MGSVTYSADGRWLASAGGEGIKIWDSATGGELLDLPGGSTLVLFNRTGNRMFTSSDNGIQLYALKIEDLIALAKSRLTRSLTTEECQKYLHVDACPALP